MPSRNIWAIPRTSATRGCSSRSRATPAARAEARRLVDWFHRKFHEEVTSYLVDEKVFRRFGPQSASPDMEAMRAGHENLRYHLAYIGHLAETRSWLAGDAMSFADLAAAAHLSALDYLGEVPWEEHEAAKNWYALLKSRPSFRPLLQDRVAGLHPVGHLCRPRFLTVRHARRTDPNSRFPGFRHARNDGAMKSAETGSPRRPRRSASTPCASPPPTPSKARAMRSTRFSPRAGRATWPGSPRTAERRKAPRALWPEAQQRHPARLELWARPAIRWRSCKQRSRGAISIYAQGADYHDVLKAKLKPLAARVQALTQRRGEDLRRYRAGDGEAARRARRARLAGQAHQPRVARVRLVAVHRLDLHHAPRSSPTRPRRIIAAPAGAASTSARRTPSPRPTGSMRAPASPTSPSSIRDISRRASARRWATASSAATIASPSARGTNSRKARARRSSRVQSRKRQPAARRAARPRRCRVPRALPRHADQAHRPRPLPAQCADRRRQFAATRRSCLWSRRGSTTPRRWCAPWRCGRWRVWRRSASGPCARAHANDPDPAVRSEWMGEAA